MRQSKSFLRNKSLLRRRKKHASAKKFNFNLIFNLIRKHFHTKKIIIGSYYPADYEVDILRFIQEATKKRYKISLPIVKPSNQMSFEPWLFKEPLYVNQYGILEPQKLKKETIPDLILVPLVAFDKNLNRIGYGKGYYDRYLNKINKNKKKTISLGVAYSFQKCKKIKTNKHDYKLDYIFTEKGIFK